MRMMKNIRVGLSLTTLMLGICAAAQAGEAKISELTGEAFIVSKDGIYRAKTGMTCGDGDMVMTREGCRLDLVFNGRAGCRLLPNTTFAIASTDESGTKLLVAEGNVVLNIKPMAADSQFTVDTPTAVAAVRGTQFWGRVAGSENDTLTTFAVKEGIVRITAKDTGRTVDLQAGQAADLAAGIAGPQTRPAEPEELEAMKAADQIAM